MSQYLKNIGRLGENIACNYLSKNGYEVLLRNFHTRFSEIDIIAKKDGSLVFFEIKTRVGDEKGKPYEAINRRKIVHLKRAVASYLLINKIKECKLSLDVISIILDKKLQPIETKHFKNIEINQKYYR